MSLLKEEKVNPKIFPIILIILDIAAAGVYLCHGDIRKTIYWISAAALTIVVTF